MVTDQEIAKGVETVLRQSDPNAVTSLNGVVQQLEAKLGLDLSHKAGFIRDQISFLLRSHPVVSKDLLPPPPPYPQSQSLFPNTFPSSPPSPQTTFNQQPHFSLHQPQQQQNNLLYPPPPPPPQQTPAKRSAPAGTKKRGGPGGLNKVCGVSTELQPIVGAAALPRTEIVKQLWVYIRKHNLQDPGNKRKIICDDALRLVFDTDSTDMFNMNKLLAKHILPLDPTKQPSQAKKQKVEDESAKPSTDTSPPIVVISDALAKFYETGEKEMLQSEALGRVWEYIKVNQLEDPLNPMVIHCDVKLQELLGCESISALGIQEMLARHHLFKRS